MSITIASRELTHSTASVMRRVAGGERVVVTVSGVPKAVIVPYVDSQQSTRLQELDRAALLIPATSPVQPIAHTGSLEGHADEILAEDRADQWH